MGTTEIIFLMLSLIGLVGAIGVISGKKAVHSLLSLVVVFFSVTGLLILMNAQSLAMAQLAIYAGSVSILFLYVILLTQLVRFSGPIIRTRYVKLAGGVVALLLLIILIAVISPADEIKTPVRPGTNVGFSTYMGKVLFRNYLLPFVITGVVFLVSAIGVVLINKNKLKSENT